MEIKIKFIMFSFFINTEWTSKFKITKNNNMSEKELNINPTEELNKLMINDIYKNCGIFLPKDIFFINNEINNVFGIVGRYKIKIEG